MTMVLLVLLKSSIGFVLDKFKDHNMIAKNSF